MKQEIVAVNEPHEELLDLPELVRSFSRYKWGIAAITLLSAAVAALIAFSLRPMYRGTVALLIESQNQHVAQIGDIYDSELPEVQYLGSQLAILKSRDLARRTVERLDLVGSDELESESGEGRFQTLDLRRYLPFLPDKKALESPPTEEERLEEAIDTFMERVTVEPFGRTQVVKVHFDAYSPKLAAEVANTLADLYIESGLQARLDATTKATSWLTDKLAEIQGKLEQSEAALQQFREDEKLINVGGARSLTEDEVLDYSKRLREAQRRRTELQNIYEKTRQAGGDTRRLRDISGLLIDPIVQKANESYLSANEAIRQLEERYGGKHPQMVSARARLANAEAALNEQLRIAAQGVRTEYEIALESERDLIRQLETAKARVQRLDRKDYELSVLQREVSTYRELYDTFLTRFKETDVAGSFQSVSARIIDPAVEPRIAQSPQKKKIVLLAALSGLAVGILLAILHFLLSEGIQSAEELEGLAQLPVFGVLPLVSGFGGRRHNLPKFFSDKSKTTFAEGVRSVCAALRIADSAHTLKRIMITSSVPEEGKSSLSGTLALALGASERVLLIETDLRKPALRRLFNLPRDAKGLSDVLGGTAPVDECLHYYEPGKIWILPAGRLASAPTDVLDRQAFHDLLEQLTERFDRILLDSPPCQAAADALVLGRQCNGVLFVVKSDSTSRRAVKSSLRQARQAGAPLLGLVINQVDARRNPHYADSHRYAYGYYG